MTTEGRRAYDPKMVDLKTLAEELKNQINVTQSHIERFKQHEIDEKKRHDNFLVSQGEQKKAIEELTKSTKGMIDAWEAANGAIKVANNIGKLMKWLSSLAILGGVYVWFKSHGQ